MPKFTIRVVEKVSHIFDPVEIEADDEEAAHEIAEQMRVQGELGEATQFVEDVDIIDASGEIT